METREPSLHLNALVQPFRTMAPSYQDSGFTGVQGRELTESDGSYHYWVDEAAISFATAEESSAFLLDHARCGADARVKPSAHTGR